MPKGNLQSLFCGIIFCISITALIIACLAFTKGNGGPPPPKAPLKAPFGGPPPLGSGYCSGEVCMSDADCKQKCPCLLPALSLDPGSITPLPFCLADAGGWCGGPGGDKITPH